MTGLALIVLVVLTVAIVNVLLPGRAIESACHDTTFTFTYSSLDVSIVPPELTCYGASGRSREPVVIDRSSELRWAIGGFLAVDVVALIAVGVIAWLSLRSPPDRSGGGAYRSPPSEAFPW